VVTDRQRVILSESGRIKVIINMDSKFMENKKLELKDHFK
jgi:hypothetical protein